MRNGLRLDEMGHQRNGGGGTGFFVAGLTLKQPGCEPVELLAIVPDPQMEWVREGKGVTDCFIVDPLDLQNKWRGDYLGTDLVPAMVEHEDAAWPDQYPDAAKKLPVMVTTYH